ncbi:MAG: metallophosphoesterase [Rikenellaceae bacterium]
MIKIFFVLVFVIGLLCEMVVYRRFFIRATKALRLCYLILAVVIPLAAGISMYLNSRLVSSDSMAVASWATWLFVLNLKIKILVSWVVLAEAIARRRFRYSAHISIFLALLAGYFLIGGATFGRNNLRVEQIEISSDRIPASFDGYRIAQFSDTHLGNLSWTHIMEDLVLAINSFDVDLVFQTGDLVNTHYQELYEYIPILSQIESRDGVVSVLGNHDLGFYLAPDFWITPQQTFDSLRAMQRERLGWILLENDSFFVHRGGDSIAVAGVTYPSDMNHNNRNADFGGSDLSRAMRGVSDSTYSILAAHTPKMFDSIPLVSKVDLTLSGHVHAMQAKIKIGDWQWSPAKFMYDEYSGFYQRDDYMLYINDGIGYVIYPMRIAAQPELTIITLRHKK